MPRQPHVLEYATRRRIDWQAVIVAALLPSIVWALVRGPAWLKELRVRSEIIYQINHNLEFARSKMGDGNFSEAQLSVDRARLAACAEPTVFSSRENFGFHTRIDQADLELNAAREKAISQSHISREVIEAQIRRQINEVVCTRTGTIDDLTATMRTLMEAGKTAEALQTCDQILILDPQNCQAAHARWIMTRGR